MIDLIIISLSILAVGILPTIRQKLCPTDNPDEMLERAQQRQLMLEFIQTKMDKAVAKNEDQISRLSPRNAHRRYASHDSPKSLFIRPPNIELQSSANSQIKTRRSSIQSQIPLPLILEDSKNGADQTDSK